MWISALFGEIICENALTVLAERAPQAAQGGGVIRPLYNSAQWVLVNRTFKLL